MALISTTLPCFPDRTSQKPKEERTNQTTGWTIHTSQSRAKTKRHYFDLSDHPEKPKSVTFTIHWSSVEKQVELTMKLEPVVKAETICFLCHNNGHFHPWRYWSDPGFIWTSDVKKTPCPGYANQTPTPTYHLTPTPSSISLISSKVRTRFLLFWNCNNFAVEVRR